jgi:hypothetical protein
MRLLCCGDGGLCRGLGACSCSGFERCFDGLGVLVEVLWRLRERMCRESGGMAFGGDACGALELVCVLET